MNDYSNFGKEKFIHDYSLINWSSLSDSNKSVNEHFNYFYKKTNDCINLHVQKKKVTKNMLKLQSKPWINSHIKKLMNYRDMLFNAMIKLHHHQIDIYIKNLEIELYLNSVERRLTTFKIILIHIKPISKCYGQALDQ